MKEITIKLVSSSAFEGEEANEMEMVSDAQIAEKQGAIYITYEEAELEGVPQGKVSLKIRDDRVKMTRYGKNGQRSEMEFQVGRDHVSDYYTEFGTMELRIHTLKVENQISMEGGFLKLDYKVVLNGMANGENHLSLMIV
ncbi:MAG: DUF1934 domain-containing protein [Clostridia bacterium]|nr:DUF1934 domain-containing protein [Clostridia bacterium]